MKSRRSGERDFSQERLGGTRLRTRALDLLSRRDHSVLELRRKLLQKGAAADEVEPLCEEFLDRGYLDDERFAENFVRARSGKSWGRRRYHLELMARGVEAEIVNRVLEHTESLDRTQQLEKLERLIEKDLRKGREAPKIVASMLRRGFSQRDVQAVLNRSTE